MSKRCLSFLSALVLGCVLILSGCAAGGRKQAANFIKDYYQGWIDGNISAEVDYDDYLSQQSKDLLGLTREEYISNLNTSQESINVKFTDIEVVGEEKMDHEIYRIRRTLTSTSNAGEQKDTGYDYVIQENGEMRILQYGAFEKKDFQMPAEKPRALNITMPTAYTTVDSMVLRLDVKNESSTNYAIGYMGNGQIVVTTDKGEFTQEMQIPPETLMMATGTRTGLFEIDKARGEIQKVTINNIYALGSNLRPVNVHNSFSMTIYDVAGY